MVGCSPVACHGSFAIATSSERTGRMTSINPSRTREARLRLAFLGFDDQGFKPCAQLGVRHSALGAQGHEFGQ